MVAEDPKTAVARGGQDLPDEDSLRAYITGGMGFGDYGIMFPQASYLDRAPLLPSKGEKPLPLLDPKNITSDIYKGRASITPFRHLLDPVMTAAYSGMPIQFEYK